jgi:hypothetical protein
VDRGVPPEARAATIEASGGRAVHFLGDLVIVHVDKNDRTFASRLPQGFRLAASPSAVAALLGTERRVEREVIPVLELRERRAAGRTRPTEGKHWDELLDDGEGRQ